jgi:glyoxylase-like metal-dependent hydrolase (beta-lactamase superfamily II)
LKAVGLHADVVVATSRAYATTCTLVRSGGEAFCIDSPVFPDELEIVPAVAQQAGFGVVGLLATHADWDHLLGGYAFPEAPLGAAETSAARLRNEIGAAQRELRAFDDELYVERPGPLSLPGAQSLPVPGHCGIGDAELELHPADGHTSDGMAVWVPWARVLIAGDYLSPVEIPMLNEGGSAGEYLETLERLGPLVAAARHVVPGHGPPIEGAQAAAILEQDAGYLQDLAERGADAELPEGRRSPEMRRIHARNAERAAEG